MHDVVVGSKEVPLLAAFTCGSFALFNGYLITVLDENLSWVSQVSGADCFLVS